jgi:hypothetical protein
MKSITYYTPTLDEIIHGGNLRPVHKEEVLKVEVACLLQLLTERETDRKMLMNGMLKGSRN